MYISFCFSSLFYFTLIHFVFVDTSIILLLYDLLLEGFLYRLRFGVHIFCVYCFGGGGVKLGIFFRAGGGADRGWG